MNNNNKVATIEVVGEERYFVLQRYLPLGRLSKYNIAEIAMCTKMAGERVVIFVNKKYIGESWLRNDEVHVSINGDVYIVSSDYIVRRAVPVKRPTTRAPRPPREVPVWV